jgi:hypothetical protein
MSELNLARVVPVADIRDRSLCCPTCCDHCWLDSPLRPSGCVDAHVQFGEFGLRKIDGIFPAEIDAAAFSGAPAPSSLSADEKVAYESLQFVYQKGIAYGFQMGLRPQTLYGIADSPVGLAAYFLDYDARSYELIARVFAGVSEGLTRDDILDNITITWRTNTALSGARLYWEYFGKGYFNAKGVSIPVAVSVFPDELYAAPRSWAEQAYPKLIHYNKLEKGGHLRPGSSLSYCPLRFGQASDHYAKAKATQSRHSAQIDKLRAESMESAFFLYPEVRGQL